MRIRENIRSWKERIWPIKSWLEKRPSKNEKQKKEAKDRIMRRLGEWLDEVLTAEKPLEGIDQQLLSELEGRADSAPKTPSGPTDDLYSTWSAMAALTQEVKLQGRAFKELSRRFAPLSDMGATIDGLAESHREAVADARSMAEDAHAALTHQKADLKTEADIRARRDVVDVLLDIRERLRVGLESTRESREALEADRQAQGMKKWFKGKDVARQQAIEIVAALKKGYRMGLERLDETIEQFGVHEVACAGKPFDPVMMTAVDMEERSDVSDGVVLEVYRTGYFMGTEIIRTAQVKVARGPEPDRSGANKAHDSK